jgi:tight adherence protein C
MTPLALGLLTFGSLSALVLGIAWMVANSNAPMFARLRALTQPPGSAPAAGTVRVLVDERPKGEIEKLLTRIGGRSSPAEEPKHELVRSGPARPTVPQLLIQAGIRRPNAPALLMGIRMATAGALLLLGLPVASVLTPSLIPILMALTVVGYVLPRFVVARMAARRRDNIERHLPDAIDLLLLCVEAGLGLNAALIKVAEERGQGGQDPIAQELTQLAKELQVGMPRREAFRNLSERTGVSELRSLAAHMIQSERFGSSIGATLRMQSETMRTHRRLLAEELANKTQVKLLFPLILFIFPSVMIVVLMPAVMRLIESLSALTS